MQNTQPKQKGQKMALKYCQSHKCHTYDTKDRKRGSKGNRKNQTRRRSDFYYGGGNFCSLNCYNDWADDFMDRAIDQVSGRITRTNNTNRRKCVAKNNEDIIGIDMRGWWLYITYFWYNSCIEKIDITKKNLIINLNPIYSFICP